MQPSQVISAAIAFIQLGLDLQRMEAERAAAGVDGFSDAEMVTFRNMAKTALDQAMVLIQAHKA